MTLRSEEYMIDRIIVALTAILALASPSFADIGFLDRDAGHIVSVDQHRQLGETARGLGDNPSKFDQLIDSAFTGLLQNSSDGCLFRALGQVRVRSRPCVRALAELRILARGN